MRRLLIAAPTKRIRIATGAHLEGGFCSPFIARICALVAAKSVIATLPGPRREKEKGGPTMTGNAGLGQEKDIFVKSDRHCFDSSGAATIALRVACSRIIYGNTHTLKKLWLNP